MVLREEATRSECGGKKEKSAPAVCARRGEGNQENKIIFCFLRRRFLSASATIFLALFLLRTGGGGLASVGYPRRGPCRRAQPTGNMLLALKNGLFFVCWWELSRANGD